ncbi:polycystin-1-like protein 2 [Heterodontus francisci]|uniref:polycystin-1-like protein 2 n=1 Tax=Heterodontus francisci TaxID=7792 RepID=UPI00355B7843
MRTWALYCTRNVPQIVQILFIHKVGLQTTPDQSHCLCNHLTFFGSTFFVMPNKLDLTQIPELFAQTSQNPVVVSLVATIFGVYIIAVVWARIKDRNDLTKVTVTVLFDNDPLAQYRYLIRVHTGHRKGAATTAKVVIMLSGSAGHSDPHFLTDSEKPVFERGGVDEFLLTTFSSLGDLQSIRLWHDNSGSSPSWYVSRVAILDVEAGQRWHFICNSWLAIDIDENIVDKIFFAASDAELNSFKNLFFMKTAESLTDEHIWVSVVERPSRSSFTRVQRVSCCFSLLLGSMLTNIMFWGTSPDESPQHMTLGNFSFFLEELIIGIESAFIMFPINLGIVQIFRSIRHRPNEPKTLEYKGVRRSSSNSVHTHPLTLESLLQGRSSLTNMIEFFEEVTRRVNEGHAFDVPYTDFSKAFDKVPDGRLVMKVKAHGSKAKCYKATDQELESGLRLDSYLLAGADTMGQTASFHAVNFYDFTYVVQAILLLQAFENITIVIKVNREHKHLVVKPQSEVNGGNSWFTFADGEFQSHLDVKRIINLISRTLKDGVPALEEEVNNTSDINQLFVLLANILQMSVEQSNMSENGDTTIPIEENYTTDLRNQRPEKEQCCLYTLLEQVEENLNQMGASKFQNPYSQIQAVDQVQKMMYFLRSSPQFKDTVYERPLLSYCSALTKSNSSQTRLLVLIDSALYINTSKGNNITKDNGMTRGNANLSNDNGWEFPGSCSHSAALMSADLFSPKFMKNIHEYQKVNLSNTIKKHRAPCDIFSFAISLLLNKVLCAAAFVALFVRKVDHHVDERAFHLASAQIFHSATLLNTTGKPDNALRMDRNSKIYQPPTVQFVEQLKEMKRIEKKMYAMIQKILVHLVFLSLLLTIAYGEQNPNSFYLNRAINQTFTPSFNVIRSNNDFYTWANKSLLPNLYGSHKGFITDGYSKLLGSPRIRQVRVKKLDCPALKILKNIVQKCEVPYSFDEEDMSNYREQWTNKVSVQASNLSYIWQYQSKLQEYPFWRNLALYRGGGYVAELTSEIENASRIVKYLAESNWIDSYTRAIFVEFTVYNANVNLFCVTTLTLETNGIGVFITSTDLESMQLVHNSDITILFAAVKIAYMLFVAYYMVVQGKLLREQNWKYFQDKGNLMEMSIILCSWSAFALFLKQLSLESETLDYYLKNPQRFVSFHRLVIINSALNFVIAVLVALTTVKLWCLLHLNPKLHLFTSAMERAWEELKGLFVILVLLLVAYSSVSYVMLSPNLSAYSTFFKATATILQLQLGHFNYNEVLELYPTAGAIIIATCTICMTFVVLNLFLSVILVTFTEERHSPIPSDDQEVIDLLLKKLCGFFGIQSSVKSSQQKRQTKKP